VIFVLFSENNFFWNFSYQCYLRSFDVKMSCCRRLSRASTKRFLIRLQKSFISVRCSCLFNQSRAVTCRENKWKWMNWMCVFSFNIFRKMIRKFSKTIRKATFCIFMSCVVVALTLFDRSCDVYQTRLS
jgi:hypothetical protein